MIDGNNFYLLHYPQDSVFVFKNKIPLEELSYDDFMKKYSGIFI